jgi:hypothetical protein
MTHVFQNCVFGQDKQFFRFEFSQRLPVVHVPNWGTRAFEDAGNETSLNSRDLSVQVVPFHFRNMSLGVGFTRNYTRYVLEKYLLKYHFSAFGTSPASTVVLEKPLDYESISKQTGVELDFRLQLKKNEKYIGFVGVRSASYFFEDFKYRYMNDDPPISQQVGGGANGETFGYLEEYNSLPFWNHYAATNLQLYYGYNCIPNKHISFAAKLSLGTNLHSDWDQFRKFLWLGVGVEMGILNLKTKKQTNDK